MARLYAVPPRYYSGHRQFQHESSVEPDLDRWRGDHRRCSPRASPPRAYRSVRGRLFLQDVLPLAQVLATGTQLRAHGNWYQLVHADLGIEVPRRDFAKPS